MKEIKKQKFFEKNWFTIGLIVLVSSIVYANTLKNDFIYDDTSQIVENHRIRNIRFAGKFFTSSVWSYNGK
ncbi:MAG: hypothetical protein ABIJ15_01775 [bacterium]